MEEGSRPCTAEDDLAGRWVSKNYLAPQNLELDSPFFDWVQTQVSLLVHLSCATLSLIQRSRSCCSSCECDYILIGTLALHS